MADRVGRLARFVELAEVCFSWTTRPAARFVWAWHVRLLGDSRTLQRLMRIGYTRLALWSMDFGIGEHLARRRLRYERNQGFPAWHVLLADLFVSLLAVGAGAVLLPGQVETVLDVDVHRAQHRRRQRALVGGQGRTVRMTNIEDVVIAANVLEGAARRLRSDRRTDVRNLQDLVFAADETLRGKLCVFVLVVSVSLLALLVAGLHLRPRFGAHHVENLFGGPRRFEEPNLPFLARRTADEHVGAIECLGLDDLGLG